MTAGRLRHRLVLEDFAQTPDEEISLTETFGEIGRTWGEVTGIGDAIYAATAQLEESVTHRITIRWRPVQTFDHISRASGGQRWRVRGIRDPDGTRRFLQIEAEEIRRA